MTLVVTTVSKYGITVVGDKAASWVYGQGIATNAQERKVFVSTTARISVALWGSAGWPGGGWSQWVLQFVNSVTAEESLDVVAERFCTEVNAQLNRLDIEPGRRGAHFAGFVKGIPHLYHVHTGGEGETQHGLRVFRDFPEIHVGGEKEYRDALGAGHIFMLRNGLYGLHTLMGGERLDELRRDFQSQYGKPLPAPNLEGQLWFSASLVRLAAGLILAADAAATVSEDLDGFAFDETGGVLDLRIDRTLTIGKEPLTQHDDSRIVFSHTRSD
jgi:hypothetical protein